MQVKTKKRNQRHRVKGKMPQWNRCPECELRFWLGTDRIPMLEPVVCELCEVWLLDWQYAYDRSPQAVLYYPV